jgi:hypothetical protein
MSVGLSTKLEKRMRSAILTVLSVATLFGMSYSQQLPPASTRLPEILVRFESTDRTMRKAAFNDLVRLASGEHEPNDVPDVREKISSFLARNQQDADSVKLALIKLLARENSVKHPQIAGDVQRRSLESAESHTEDEYYPKLISAVATINDERAIPALLGAASTGGMAMRAVVAFGQKAFDPVIGQLASSDRMARSSALFTVRYMLRMGPLDPSQSQTRLTVAIQESLHDPEFVVRSSAISVVECLDNRQEFVPVLQKLAQSDPIRLPGRADDGGDLYPVRIKAKKVLKEIEENRRPSGESMLH